MTHILITRPQGKGAALAQQLEQAGYQASLFPVLKIDYLTPSNNELSPLFDADKIIFISQDAVIGLAQLKPNINIKAQFYAIGQKTADTIYELFGVRAAVPKTFDSEGLLALKTLEQIEGSHVVLVKGQDGRPDIAKTLKERGAFLNHCIVYKRSAVEGLVSDWITSWKNKNIHDIVITSNAAVDAIFKSQGAGELAWLQQRRFYVASERIATYLQQQKISAANIHVAVGASDSAMFTCIHKQTSKVNEPLELKAKKTAANAASQSTSTSSTSIKGKSMAENKQKISKVGSLALIISLIVASGVGFEFYQKLNEGKNQNLLVNELSEQNKLLQQDVKILKSAQYDLQQALFTSEQKLTATVAENTAKNEQLIKAALQQGSSLDPQEVARLQRMAEFKLWAEKDYQGTSAVLKRLASLLNEQPGTVTVRQAIMDDIQTLDSIKPVAVEAIYMQLGSILNNIDSLNFNTVNLPKEVVTADDNKLSEDVSDWRRNLSNSLDQFLNGFITIRHREGGAIEPLLNEQQKHLVNQRIKLYITQAQDALLSKQASIYVSAITKTKELISEYFKQDDQVTKMLLKSLSNLEKEPLNFNPEVTLKSTQQVKEWAQ